MNTYQLTITEKQASVIACALDMWDRTRAGQLWAVEHELRSVTDPAQWPALEAAIITLRDIAFPEGFDRKRPAVAGVAFNLRKVLDAATSWTRNPEGSWTVNYDGPIAGWWDGEPPAVCLRWEGEEAVRVRDRANKTQRLGARLVELVGTEDIEEATRIVAEWKYKAEAYRP